MLKFTVALGVCALAGCVTAPSPTHNPGVFKAVQSDEVRPESIQPLSDCIMDGLDSASFISTNKHVRQQRRVGGYRIDVQTNTHTLLTVSLLDRGSIEVRESEYAALINLADERAAIAACVTRLK